MKILACRLAGHPVTFLAMLTWSAHVDTVYSKVARKIGAMKRTSRQLSLKARRSFFLSVIQPDLEYAAGACVPSMPESQRQRLLSLWRKAVRCTAGADKHADVYSICGELSITPLLHRWALSFALQVRRCYLNIAPAQLCDKLVRPCHKHSTRGNNSSLYPFRSSSLSRVQYLSQIDRRFCGMLYNLSLDLKYQHFHNQDSKSLSSIFFLFILSSFRLQLATLIAVYNFLVQCYNSCHNDFNQLILPSHISIFCPFLLFFFLQ